MSKRKTHEEYVAQVAEINPNIDIISQYVNNMSNINYRCKQCGFVDHSRADALYKYRPCRNCEGNGWITYGVNDFYTLRPDIAKYMEDQELAHKIGSNYKEYVWFICPDCGIRFKQKPTNAVKCGLSCPACSSGRSYPNKFMFNILKSVGIDFINEFSDSWTEGYLYDFMFEVRDNKYLIEMDGTFHFRDNPKSGTSIEGALLRDENKNKLAKVNRYDIIHVDCNYMNINERYEYVKNNILSSKLSELIGFSVVNFDSCDILSQKSDFIRICEIYDSGVHDIDQIREIIGLSSTAIIAHLKHSEEIGCSTYNHVDAMCERNEFRKNKVAKTNGQLLYCIETNEIFYSIAAAKRCYGGNIDSYLKGEIDYAGILDDGTKLHYNRISQEESDSLVVNNNAKCILVDFNRENDSRNLRKLKHIVICNQTNEWFANRAIANKKYHASITHYLTGKATYSGVLADGTKLTWYTPSIEEIDLYINSGGVITYKFT